MSDEDKKDQGKDFLIGFASGSIVVAVTAAIMTNTESVVPLWWAGAGLTVASLTAVNYQRPYIGLGIATTLVAVPLLFIGSCFAMFSGI